MAMKDSNLTAERIKQYLAEGKRFDGRKTDEFRDISIECGVSKKAEGSAKVKIGKTEVWVGVKLGVMSPYSDSPDKGNLMVTVELTPMSGDKYELGPPKFPAIELGRLVDRGVRESGFIDLSKLCIEKGEKVWMVSVDLIPLNASGNLFDAAALAGILALKNTKMPKYDGEKVDYKEKTNKGLPLNDLPISVTVLKIGDYLIVDPLPEEEEQADARLTVASLTDGTICAMQKGGDEPVSAEETNNMINLALKSAKNLRKLVK